MDFELLEHFAEKELQAPVMPRMVEILELLRKHLLLLLTDYLYFYLLIILLI